ncbi:MAG: DotI/IcmL family type IV secretion protein [Pseudomonadota bacterium]|nr:DotI/IcmL family type IV secretion protein [Pseudomonadota bacterium]
MNFSPAHSAPTQAQKNETKKTKAAAKAALSVDKIRRHFFSPEPVLVDVVDGEAEQKRIKRLFRIIQTQVVLVAALAVTLIAGTPFFQTIFQYYAIDSSRHVIRLVPLSMPNMTKQAVLSWATNSITEIMTFGFGDYRQHLREQNLRFTPEGWRSFVHAFDNMNIGEVFRERQLVLTTVPSDTAVILSQGPNSDQVYEWKVQMPIIMTYATNNNVTRKDTAIVTLTISRVPPTYNPGGIAIKAWVQ